MRDPKRLRLRLLTAALCVCSAAAANGRFPRAQRLVLDAEQPERMAIYGTYGLLTTTDAAASWQYVCEGATGPFAGEAPLLEIMPGGRIVLSSETGLRASTFPACDWAGLLEPALPNAVQDITRDPSADSVLSAAFSSSRFCWSRVTASV